ncbi:MAG: hypothetical protein JO055_13200 [Alphaproteobacteria bacterium]|nr:hypothetical protein [Alphaproteobacteria bacterium]
MAIIVKKDGEGDTNAMMQAQTEKYLGNLLTPDRISNLKQSLNDVFGGRGKATGAYSFAGQPVLHASSGNMQKSVTLFFYMSGVNAKIFAMGEHKSSSSYSVSEYGQRGTDFQLGKTISL